MSLQVYSTLSRKKEAFHKQPGEAVSMYVCGPTVYKPSHIGHMVGPVIFDCVKRYLTKLGYTVTWIVNITDVDDKLIERAPKVNMTVPALAEQMTQDYFVCLKQLNVTGIDKFPKATEHIDGMIAMMAKLIEKGYAYASGGDVYFDVSKDADYGKLCGFDPEALAKGEEGGGKKRNTGDFALWKGAKPGEPAEVTWPSPWGPGRPGWHIECSVMSQALLGETLDIHGGGLDLRFPHHENELAQSESCSDKTFAKVWMHNGLLKLKDKDGKEDKMAGSKGNVLNVADALKHVSGEVLRFFILGTHYRSPIDLGIWDWNNPATPIPDGIVNAKRAFDTFVRFAERYQRIMGKSFYDAPVAGSLPADLEDYRKRFNDYMDDDFNTGGAVAVVFELATHLNRVADAGYLEDSAPKRSDAALATFVAGVGLLREFGQILGLFEQKPQAAKLGGSDDLTAGLMTLLIDLRNNLRGLAKGIADKSDPTKKALFDQTDVIRTRLAALGVTLEDRAGGTTWRVG